jgi:hypothetical protein
MKLIDPNLKKRERIFIFYKRQLVNIFKDEIKDSMNIFFKTKKVLKEQIIVN